MTRRGVWPVEPASKPRTLIDRHSLCAQVPRRPAHPLNHDYLDKLEHVRGAVAHRVFEEEGIWFPERQANVPSTGQTKVKARYMEEFDRYCDGAGGGFALKTPISDVDVRARSPMAGVV